MSSDMRDLLVETAHAVFGRPAGDPWVEVERAGLGALGTEAELAEVAAVVRVSAYHGTEIPFAERVLLDPLEAAGAPQGELRSRGALMRAIQMVGAMERVRELTVAYAGSRSQFGQPLARFQAVQHQLAELAGETALAAESVAAALRLPSPARVAVAKIVAGHAAGVVAGIAHQVHGAIGVTQEHELHRYTLALWRWRDEFGTEAEWAERLGAELAAAGPDRLWDLATAP